MSRHCSAHANIEYPKTSSEHQSLVTWALYSISCLLSTEAECSGGSILSLNDIRVSYWGNIKFKGIISES